MNKANTENTNKRKYILLFWIILFIPLLFFSIMFYGAANAILGFDPLPPIADLENPKSDLATEVYTADRKVLGRYFYQNRINIDYQELPENLVNALVSTEDERYYEHSGIDLRGLIRAVINLGKSGGASTITQQLAKLLFNEPATSKWERIKQKLQEWIIAAQLERRYTKDEIIAMYFNRFDFINNAVGIKSAAAVYFDKHPSELNIEESAMLVGMLKNPSLFNPLRDPDTTLHRRNVVLGQMMRNDQISREEFDSLAALPMELDYSKVDHKQGIAPYFREVLRAELKRIFNEKDAQGNYKLRKADGNKYDIYKDGLKIYTTINYKMQEYAEWAVKEHLSYQLQDEFFASLKKKKNAPFDHRVSQQEINNILNAAKRRSERYLIMSGKQCANCGRRGAILEEETIDGKEVVVCQADDCGHHTHIQPKDTIDAVFNRPTKMKVFSWNGEIDTVMSPMDSIRYYKSFLQAGMMSMDPRTGYIKAWVGGIDYDHFAYDHVRQGRRQVGSTFKPFVYAVAVDEGMSPCKEVSNVRYVFKAEEWGLPKDWSPKNSTDDYGYNVTLKYGLANSMNTITSWVMKQFGPDRVVRMARDLGIESPLDPVPSLALGVADVSVYEMTGAFSTFVNKGVWTEPIFLTRIEDKDGNVIVEYVPKTREALSEQTAYVMLDLLKGVTSYNWNEYKQKTAGGTGIRLRFAKTKERPYGGIQYPIAGKTGTTQNNSDGWFIGATPDLVTGVWVGAEDRSVRFTYTQDGQGANTGLPIFGYYMNKVYADSSLKISTEDFEKPEQPLSIELDCEVYREQDNFDGGGVPDFGS
ncbi:MAG: penicillin-binding protein [Flavobacteriales bacterium]|nr:penicillin-binding protein [Flavobacteriales bacterium]